MKTELKELSIVLVFLAAIAFIFTRTDPNTSLEKAAWTYLILIGIYFAIYLVAIFTGKVQGFIGTNLKKLIPESIIGISFGFGFILLNKINPSITIGIPDIYLAFSGYTRVIVVGILAPPIEEALFRGATPAVLSMINKMGFWWVGIGSSLIFTMAHFWAYGGSFEAASGAFLGAAIFGTVAYLVSRWRKDLIAVTWMHAIFNLYLVSQLTVALAI